MRIDDLRVDLTGQIDDVKTDIRDIVDTAAVSLAIPVETATELGLRHWGTRTVVYADERREERPVTDVTIERSVTSPREPRPSWDRPGAKS